MFEMTVDAKMIIGKIYAGLEFNHFSGSIKNHRKMFLTSLEAQK
jgi:hypothetical protein